MPILEYMACRFAIFEKMPGCDPAPVDNLFTYVDKLRQKNFYARRRVVAVMSVGSASLRVTKGKLMYKIVWLCNGVEMTSYVRASEALAFTANKQIISWQPHTYRR